MENTADALFKNDVPEWYIAQGENWVGPLTAADVYQKVVSQEISWAHFVWKPGQSEWKRICDVKSFQTVVPAVPKKALQQEIKEASRPNIRAAAKKVAPPAPQVSERTWFLYYNNSQFGPFSVEELAKSIRAGKIHKRVFGWRDGMPTWKRLDEVEEFATISAPPSEPPARTDQRHAPRRPLLAKIILADEKAVQVAVCRDISIGGMQVLTDKVPGQRGKRIKMNVSTSGGEMSPFVAEGVIVRVLEDQRGFSFRFEKLSEDAKRTIESYIRAEESA